MTIKPLQFSDLTTVPLSKRRQESDEADFASPFHAGGSFADFLASLPNLHVAATLFSLRDAIVSTHRRGRPVIVGLGGHVIDSGLSPLLVRLLEQRVVTGVVMTGAAMLQDVEIALAGHTLRCRDQELVEGRYCVTEETGRLINEAINFGVSEGWGFGQSVGQKLLDEEAPHRDHSILATARRYHIPVTVHPAIGADAFNLHPLAHGESLGAAGMYDARLLAGMMAEATGAVVLNIASGAVVPRVLIQAVDAARNLGHRVEGMHCAVLDSNANSAMVADVLGRLSQPGGQGYMLPGPDEMMVPLLFAAVLEALGDDVA